MGKAQSIHVTTAPTRIETGRYDKEPAGRRFCFKCESDTQDESHVLLNDDCRRDFYDFCRTVIVNSEDLEDCD